MYRFINIDISDEIFKNKQLVLGVSVEWPAKVSQSQLFVIFLLKKSKKRCFVRDQILPFDKVFITITNFYQIFKHDQDFYQILPRQSMSLLQSGTSSVSIWATTIMYSSSPWYFPHSSLRVSLDLTGTRFCRVHGSEPSRIQRARYPSDSRSSLRPSLSPRALLLLINQSSISSVSLTTAICFPLISTNLFMFLRSISTTSCSQVSITCRGWKFLYKYPHSWKNCSARTREDSISATVFTLLPSIQLREYLLASSTRIQVASGSLRSYTLLMHICFALTMFFHSFSYRLNSGSILLFSGQYLITTGLEDFLWQPQYRGIRFLLASILNYFMYGCILPTSSSYFDFSCSLKFIDREVLAGMYVYWGGSRFLGSLAVTQTACYFLGCCWMAQMFSSGSYYSYSLWYYSGWQ